jgi:hypothetical protein
MAAWKDHWPLVRRWAFLKRRLLALPQKPHSMEVDFCPLPDIVSDQFGFWLGLVVDPVSRGSLSIAVLPRGRRGSLWPSYFVGESRISGRPTNPPTGWSDCAFRP